MDPAPPSPDPRPQGTHAAALPAGNVTFLFTDVEASTRLFQQHPEAMKTALARHNELLQQAIAQHHGHVFQVQGDGFCVAFAQAPDALYAALAAQRALHREPWGPVGTLRVRMGLHSGIAELQDGEYATSLTLARTQRVAAAGHGGQILLSSAAATAVANALPRTTTLRNLGAHKLRGIAQPEVLHELVAPDLPSGFPPPRVEESVTASSTPLERLARARVVGRATEQAQLRQRWADAQQSRAQLVLVSGEPGVGKTRLATELVDFARETGATVLRGGCYEFEATTPYLPFVEAFREWTHWQSAETLKAVVNGTPQIVKLAPEIETRGGGAPASVALSSSEERLRLFDNAGRFLESLAADNGLLIFIDDLHWADQGTLSLLHYLARQLRHRRVLFLATYRETELDRTHPLSAALVDWNRERLAVRVSLARLPRAATAELLCALFGVERISDELVDALYKETEGNPFFVEEVIKALIEQGEIYREGDAWSRKATSELSIPQSVKEAIGRRLTRLSTATVDVLRTSAALGKHFAFRDLAVVSDAGEDALLDALDEASAAQLVRPHKSDVLLAADEGFVFTHDKIREVLYEELNPIRRRRLHQRIGEALEKLHAQSIDAEADHRAAAITQDLAHHFTLAGDLQRSMTYARRAARHAEGVFAHDEALKFLEQSRESAEALNRDEAIYEIDVAIGYIQELRGFHAEAVASYERALERAGSAAQRAEMHAEIGAAYCAVGDPRGLPFLDSALEGLDIETQRRTLALVTATKGRFFHYRTEHRSALEYLDKARVLAEPIDDPALVNSINLYLAGTHQHLLQFEESDRWARECIALGERRNFPEAIAGGYEFLGENRCARALWSEGLSFGIKDREFAEKGGSLVRLAWAQFTVAQATHGLGRLDEALAAAQQGLALCEQIGEKRLATWMAPMSGIAAADMGDEALAETMSSDGWVRAQELDQLVLSAFALHALGHVAFMRGDIAQAATWYGRYTDLVRDTENGVCRIIGLGSAGRVLARAGDLDRASEAATRAIEVAQFAKAPNRLAVARSAQGDILVRRSRFEEARNAYDEAIGILTTHEGRLERAHTLCSRAMLLADMGDGDAARRDAGQARAELAAMGAVIDKQSAGRLAAL